MMAPTKNTFQVEKPHTRSYPPFYTCRSLPRPQKVKTGIAALDQLLDGGFETGLLTLLYGDSGLNEILRVLAITAQLPQSHGGLNTEVTFLDADNIFNPYQVAHIASQNNLEPSEALRRIHIVRAFNFNMLIETIVSQLETQLRLKPSRTILVSGLTSHFQNEGYTVESIRALGGAAGLLRNIAMQQNAIVVCTSPVAEHSLYKPAGGTALQHTAQVHIQIRNHKRLTEYRLVKHPSIQMRRTIHWHEKKVKTSANLTLDMFVEPQLKSNSGMSKPVELWR